jgi:hypothetical protein
MRYLVKARLKSGKERALAQAIDEGTLGQGSIAGDEYLDDMEHARLQKDGTAVWVEVLLFKRNDPIGKNSSNSLRLKDAHSRRNCRHENGTELWACSNCSCTELLQKRLQTRGEPFVASLPIENSR